jgi:MerR family transcriptional regulator, thiopeptide resistance regulator
MAGRRTYRVSEVARISGVTVRTLHHYDEIGLLVPMARSEAGYRLYDDGDLLRLQQILLGRELGLPLEEIRRSLDDPAFDHRKTLVGQRQQLEARAHRTEEMLRAVNAALALLDDRQGGTMDTNGLFDGFDPTQYEAEVTRSWGDTEAYRESAKRSKRYGSAEWKAIRDEQAAIFADAVAALEAGIAADTPQAMDIAERHRDSISRWFYPCSLEMHVHLADMWEADGRFAQTIDAQAAGLTPYLAAAVRANARRRSG